MPCRFDALRDERMHAFLTPAEDFWTAAMRAAFKLSSSREADRRQNFASKEFAGAHPLAAPSITNSGSSGPPTWERTHVEDPVNCPRRAEGRQRSNALWALPLGYHRKRRETRMCTREGTRNLLTIIDNATGEPASAESISQRRWSVASLPGQHGFGLGQAAWPKRSFSDNRIGVTEISSPLNTPRSRLQTEREIMRTGVPIIVDYEEKWNVAGQGRHLGSTTKMPLCVTPPRQNHRDLWDFPRYHREEARRRKARTPHGGTARKEQILLSRTWKWLASFNAPLMPQRFSDSSS